MKTYVPHINTCQGYPSMPHASIAYAVAFCPLCPATLALQKLTSQLGAAHGDGGDARDIMEDA